MPNLDRTGPMGQGPKTGRGMGPCGGAIKHGQGFWNGYGFGFRRFISPKNALAALEEEEDILEKQLIVIKEEKAYLKKQTQE